MNEKISYLNVFFQHEKEALPQLLTENIADHVPELIFGYHAAQRNIFYGNQKFSAFTGRTSSMLNPSGGGLERLIHPEDLADVAGFLHAPGTSGQKHFGPRTVRLFGRDGRYRHHELEGRTLHWNDAGEVELVVFIAHDITDTLKSKEEVETTRELLEETEELLQFGSWAWEIGTNTVTWTSGLYSLLEYQSGEVDGKIGLDFYLDHVQEEYQQTFRDIIQNALDDKRDFSYEYVIKTRSGTLKNISTRGKLVKDETGAVSKMLCINRDITALRSFEKEQERNIRELNRSNRDLEEFAYIASHDLQEPLRKISMFTERLKAKYEQGLDKEGELFIERILASAANMRTLIDNLLDFSRANRRSNSFDQVEIKAVLDGVVSELELKIEETKADIRFSGTFPTIEAVKSEMTQLFSNILSNAIKFRKDDVAAEIQVHAGKVGKAEKHFLSLPADQTFYKIEVIDNGIGFEPEYSEKIFQIFQRLNGKSEYPGSGIGLAICKKITEKHNGLIFAKSQPDEGATFTVILPEKQF
jgi:PAS domain S-box-containing protein